MTRVLALIMTCALLVGCASNKPSPPTFHIPAGHYSRAFDAAREALHDMRFELDRVDARAGVITTRAKHSSGIATPWDLEQSTLTQEWEDFTNNQSRSVRILFEPADHAAVPGMAASPKGSDLRTFEGDVVGTIIITIERQTRPNWRIDTTGIRLSSFARDPLGKSPRARVPIARDPQLEGRFARRIVRQITKSP